MIAEFGALSHALADANVEFVIIGGAALVETAKRAAGRIKDLGDLAIIAELKRRG